MDKQDLQEYFIVLNSNPPKFAIDSLIALFEIEPSMIYFKKETRLKVSQVLIPSFPLTRDSFTEGTNLYNPEVIRKINFISKSKTNPTPNKRNFIISRQKATQRRIINEKVLLKEFKNLNFEVVTLEEMSFHNQMELFRNAGVIIATHGAGHTNLVFCDKPLVIELFPTNRFNRDAFYFYQITNALNIKHHILEYESRNHRQDLEINHETLSIIGSVIREHNNESN